VGLTDNGGMNTNRTATSLTPNDLRLVEQFGPRIGPIAEHLASEDRFHATLNRSAMTPRERARAIVSRYKRSTAAERTRAAETNERLRRELGIA
jgi:hypothetical protein